MKWEKPSYSDLRFGFEVTMYIYNRQLSIDPSSGALQLCRAPLFCFRAQILAAWIWLQKSYAGALLCLYRRESAGKGSHNALCRTCLIQSGSFVHQYLCKTIMISLWRYDIMLKPCPSGTFSTNWSATVTKPRIFPSNFSFCASCFIGIKDLEAVERKLSVQSLLAPYSIRLNRD